MEKAKRQSSLENFFSKRVRQEAPQETADVEEQPPRTNDLRSPQIVNVNKPSEQLQPPGDRGNAMDIANFVLKSKNKVDLETRRKFLSEVWVPDGNFKFPAHGKRNLKFQLSWLHRWIWLTYSKVEDGAFCKPCVLFSSDGAGVGHQPLGKLVKTKFSNWKDAVEEFNKHQNTEYHKRCVVKASEFENVVLINRTSIDLQVNEGKKKQVEENRKRILPIIETIIMCGRQGLALRGHRDHGPIAISAEEPRENDGNFRTLLRFRAKSGDNVLKDHLLNSSLNSQYTSPHTQNEIIVACNEIILKELVSRVNRAKCFTVMADETSDVAGIEQMSVCVRYVDTITKKIREDFLQFVPVTDTTGRGLAKKILETLQAIGIDLENLRGQGYDGAKAMSGQFNGVHAAIKEKFPLALYMHCSSHVLNLAITDACSVPGIRNCMGIIGSASSFFKYPKRLATLKESITSKVPETEKTRLKSLCPTRWVERHDSVIVFLELFDAVVDALEVISQWQDRDTSSNAHQLLSSIQSSEFLISIQVLNKIFTLSLPLSKFFQEENIDIVNALSYATALETALTVLRENADTEFKKLFAKAEEMATKLEVHIATPRYSKRQTQRCNVPVSNPEEFYRIAVYNPFIDNFLSQVKDRFVSHRNILESFMCLLPENDQTLATDQKKKGLINLIKMYQVDIHSSESTVLGELDIWYALLSTKKKPKGAFEALLMCDEDKLPNIYKLLKVFATLPVTAATNERSFSTLKRLKTYLRNSCSENRLNGLAMLNIHRDISLSADNVINLFSTSSRRLDFKL